MSDQLPDMNEQGNGVLQFVERHLTPISVGVLLVGVGLIAAGPARSYLTRPEELTVAEVTEDPAETEPRSVTFLSGSGGPEDGFEPVIERETVPFTIIPNRQRNEVIRYTVQPGDTVSELSDRFGLSMETIFWANSDTLQDNVHLLVPGLDIFILPMNGVYHRANGEESIAQIAERFAANPNDILDDDLNELPSDSDASFVPPLGMRVMVPGGSREQIDFSWVSPAAEADTAGGTGTLFAQGHPGSCSVFSSGSGTGVWALPVNAYNFSQGFYYGHTGVDLSSVIGEPVYAADSGVVIFAGWNDWGYGNLVAINHGAGGWTTLYAHLNSINVGCGQTVSRGSQIGTIGSTGNSTGPHLHFEMRWGLGMAPDNPSAYIGF